MLLKQTKKQKELYMKSVSVLVILVAAYLATACGIPKQMSKDCGGDLEMGCKTLFGDSSADDEREANQSQSILALQNQMASLKANIETTLTYSSSSYASMLNIRQAISILESENAGQDAEILALQVQVAALASSLEAAQTDIYLLQSQYANLATAETIMGYLDCGGDGPGFDEVVLRTSSGKLIAYFKDNGSREFLTVLTPGNYQTTDESRCNFSVSNTGTFCDSLGCR
jgi:hypothetical protein